MINNSKKAPYLLQPFPLFFTAGLILVNVIAIFDFDPYYVGSLFSFLYIVIMPGFLFLPLLTTRKFAPLLGVAFSVALSLLTLMVSGLAINTVLPLFGIQAPLTTLPLLIVFDITLYVLLVGDYIRKGDSPFEFHTFKLSDRVLAGIAILLPIGACLGAIILNNGGSNFIPMLLLGVVVVLLPVLLFKEHLNPSTPPFMLYALALTFLLMNSMRGWFITGHDILLEYHVFILTNTAHLWNIAFYQDPYNACLSLTILPTFIEQLIHVSPFYIFKFFTQFIGAAPVVIIYYILKRYVSDKVALLAGFLYITFPTFMVDMAFLNRQGIAFVFFAALIYTLFDTEYFIGWKRTFTLFLLGIGVVISHYSTSYVAIAVLLIAYVINRFIRLIVGAHKPTWLFRLTNKLSNKEIYQKPILLTLPFVLGMLCIMLVWSTLVTKTSTSLFNTIEQIVQSVEHPFASDGYNGPAKYSLFASVHYTPQQLFNQFLTASIKENISTSTESEFYPLSLTEKYQTIPVAEPYTPATPFGEHLQSLLHVNLSNAFNEIKQLYAKIIQIFLFIGLLGMIFGYGFKKNLLQSVPTEFIALSIAGLAVIVGQTVLPGNAVDYGLLRLFQQNLTFLLLPIILGFVWVASLVTRNHKGQLAIIAGALLFFYIILSGFFTQFTGLARAPLPLDNYGLYYDSYYVHAQEVSSIQWLAKYGDPYLPIQTAHFSDIKMIAYGQIGSYIELLPETTKKKAYVYLNYDNVQTNDIIEIVNGNVVYYHFPMNFLQDNKDLIYNNGGGQIYR